MQIGVLCFPTNHFILTQNKVYKTVVTQEVAAGLRTINLSLAVYFYKLNS